MTPAFQIELSILIPAIVVGGGAIGFGVVLLKRAAMEMLMAALDGAAQDIWQA